MKNTERIIEYITNSETPVTLKELQIKLEMKPGIVSGSLAALLASKKLEREKVERKEGNGRKEQWAYKKFTKNENFVVDSCSE